MCSGKIILLLGGCLMPLDKFVDVICQYTKDGQLIPLRIKIKDEDGMYQTFTIKRYKELSHAGNHTTPYGTINHSLHWNFLCQVQVLNKLINIELFFNGNDHLWKIIRIN